MFRHSNDSHILGLFKLNINHSMKLLSSYVVWICSLIISFSRSRRSMCLDIKEESEEDNSNEDKQSISEDSTGLELSLDKMSIDVLEANNYDALHKNLEANSITKPTEEVINSSSNGTGPESSTKESFINPKSILKNNRFKNPRRGSTP